MSAITDLIGHIAPHGANKAASKGGKPEGEGAEGDFAAAFADLAGGGETRPDTGTDGDGASALTLDAVVAAAANGEAAVHVDVNPTQMAAILATIADAINAPSDLTRGGAAPDVALTPASALARIAAIKGESADSQPVAGSDGVANTPTASAHAPEASTISSPNAKLALGDSMTIAEPFVRATAKQGAVKSLGSQAAATVQATDTIANPAGFKVAGDGADTTAAAKAQPTQAVSPGPKDPAPDGQPTDVQIAVAATAVQQTGSRPSATPNDRGSDNVSALSLVQRDVAAAQHQNAQQQGQSDGSGQGPAIDPRAADAAPGQETVPTDSAPGTFDRLVAAPAVGAAASPGLLTTPLGSLGRVDVPVAGAIEARIIDMSVGGQWIDRMAQEIVQLSRGEGRSQFQINPPHLGQLTVELWQGDNGGGVRMLAETDEAVTRLNQARPALEADARLAALSLGQVSIEKQRDSADSGRGQNQGNGAQAHMSQGQNQGQGQSGQGGAAMGQGQGQPGSWADRSGKTAGQQAVLNDDVQSARSDDRGGDRRVRYA